MRSALVPSTDDVLDLDVLRHELEGIVLRRTQTRLPLTMLDKTWLVDDILILLKNKGLLTKTERENNG